ncbi:hypothetical protein TOPH_07311 [Tolypocladium ophioglossoides CBS 100239]|uniref:Rhodopsin domain-containing protein n=1 Tax=Tolypocladium ophioglossoides (strain CBS 100239) TaxID=1163406 RepID=A0A0L0N1X8_TOLOC|nr:hypothetical protein TOPH_07311 [Tolypocladium ophioglossoides CBS 100239]
MASGSPASDPTTEAAAAAAAAHAAFQKFATEAWTLLAIGIVVTILRTYSRVRSVGFGGLQADDYLVWVAAMFYAVETGLAYSVGNIAHGLANNGMTDAERFALSPSSEEYHLSWLQNLACWVVQLFDVALGAEGISADLLYSAGLNRHYLIRIYVGCGLLVASYITGMANLLLACRPFHSYWQINPDPGNVCQPAVSNQVIWVYYAFNVFTDLYLISIPIPMLWKATLRPWKKIGLILLFSGGLFVVVCATLRCILIVTDPINGAQLAGSWAVRETFVAVVTTNLPMIFPLLKFWLTAAFGSISSLRSSQKPERTPTDVRTFGGGGGNGQNWRGRGPPTANPLTNVTFSESEERMMDDVRMQDLKVWHEPSSGSQSTNGNIHKQVDVEVTHERRPDVERNQVPTGQQSRE